MASGAVRLQTLADAAIVGRAIGTTEGRGR
jgi:hypothetical protein